MLPVHSEWNGAALAHNDCRDGGLRWGVEPIRAGLSQEPGCQISPSTYYEHVAAGPTRRELADEALKPMIRQVHQSNFGVNGARKVWLTLNRQGTPVARCTVERLIRELGWAVAVRRWLAELGGT